MTADNNGHTGDCRFVVPTFGELVGHLVSILNLDRLDIGGRAGERLRPNGTVGAFRLGTRPIPQSERRILRDFAEALLRSGLVPGLDECAQPASVVPQGLVDRLQPLVGRRPVLPEPVEWLLSFLRQFADRWNAIAWDVRTFVDSGTPAGILIEPFLRCLVPDLALRWAALIRLGFCDCPPDAPPSWARQLELRPPLRDLLQQCDPRKAMPGETSPAFGREMLIEFLAAKMEQAGELHEPVPGKIAHHHGFRKTMERLLDGSDQVPEDETLRRIVDGLAPAFTTIDRPAALMQMRRYYALRAAAVRLAKVVGWPTIEGLATHLVLYTRMLADFFSQYKMPRAELDGTMRMTVLLGARLGGHRSGNWCPLNVLQRVEELDHCRLDIQAVRDANERERIRTCMCLAGLYPTLYAGLREEPDALSEEEADIRAREFVAGLQGGSQDVVEMVTEASAADPTIRGSAVVHQVRALVAMVREDWRAAVQEWGCAAAAAPDVANYPFEQARCEFYLGNWDTAAAACRRAIDVDPNEEEYHVFLSTTQRFAGRPGEAAARLGAAAGNGVAWSWRFDLELGTALHESRDYARAIAALERAWRAKPDLAEAYAYAADSKRRLGDAKGERSLSKVAHHFGADGLLATLRCLEPGKGER